MSLNVTFNGAVYIVPETGEVGWGGNTTSYLVAIAAGCLQKTGGSFTLSAETDFGADFGLQSLYYSSRNAPIATSGILRLNNNSDAVSWRDAGDTADLPLRVDSSNRLSYDGSPLLTGTGPADYVASATGTAGQVIVSASTGAVTFSLPQSIDTGANVQFTGIGLGSTLVASSILSLTSTSLGFLPPRMTTIQRDAIGSPATGLFVYNTDTGTNDYYNGVSWLALAAGGTINVGAQFQLGYYAANGTTLSGLTLITASRALVSDTNGLPVAATTSTAELQALAGLTASRALQTDGSGLVSASAVTTTELGYVSGVTSAIQTQLGAKADDSSVVHITGVETVTGAKSFSAQLLLGSSGTALAFIGDPDTGLRNANPNEFDVVTGGTTRFSVENTHVQVENKLLNQSGTILLPSYAFVGDEDSGMARLGVNNIALGTNGLRALDIDSTQAVTIKGTSQANDAGGGDVGEYIESVVSAFTNTPATAVYGDITSISLSAGDWDISGAVTFSANGSTWTETLLGISTTAGNSSTGLVSGNNQLFNQWASTSTAVVFDALSIPGYRISLASTTTIYLKQRAQFSAGQPQAVGRISARRVR